MDFTYDPRILDLARRVRHFVVEEVLPMEQ